MRAMYEQYAHESVIMVDTTFGTSRCGAALLTIMVVGEGNRGYPIAWCFISSEARCTAAVFHILRKRSPDVKPAWIMSDGALGNIAAAREGLALPDLKLWYVMTHTTAICTIMDE